MAYPHSVLNSEVMFAIIQQTTAEWKKRTALLYCQ